MKTVFIPPICNYGFLRQLPQQMASQWAKNGYKVIYCNERLVQPVQVVEVEKNLFIYPNYEMALIDMKRNSINVDIFYTTAAMTYRYIDTIKPNLVIYHSCDSFEEWKKEEIKMINKADIILCTSEFIYDLRVKQHPNVHLVKNGCNQNMFSHNKLTAFQFIKRPICTFSGALGNWVATYLIRNVAKEYYTTVIGCEFGKKVPQGVHGFRAIDHSQLGEFLSNMDIGLLPFITKQEVTQAANPIKLWEYLACGLPVVATSWTETTKEELKDVVFAAKSDDEYLELIRQYVALDDSEKEDIKNKCFDIAAKNTWELRFEYIQNVLGGQNA